MNRFGDSAFWRQALTQSRYRIGLPFGIAVICLVAGGYTSTAWVMTAGAAMVLLGVCILFYEAARHHNKELARQKVLDGQLEEELALSCRRKWEALTETQRLEKRLENRIRSEVQEEMARHLKDKHNHSLCYALCWIFGIAVWGWIIYDIVKEVE